MAIDYKALCEELFGTTDVEELRVIAKKLESKNDRGAGRKMRFSKSEILKMEQMREQGIPFKEIEREFNTSRQTISRMLKLIQSEKRKELMHRNMDIAKYFLSLDQDHSLFTNDEGKARLNKYMHLAQNIYIAKTGHPLIDTKFYAYDNGAVDPEIMEQYVPLLNKKDKQVCVTMEEERFLKSFYKAFENAPLEELIEIDHEDPAWIEKKDEYRKADQAMDSMRYAEDYKVRYADMVKVLDQITV